MKLNYSKNGASNRSVGVLGSGKAAANLSGSRSSKFEQAFSIVETLIAMVLLGVMVVSLYGGISSGFAAVNAAREGLRASQILCEKMEEFRTFAWSEIISTNIPTTFTDYFYPTNLINTTNSGVLYTGTITITNANLTEPYASSLKLISVDLTWQSGNKTHTRNMQTMVSQYGMRSYVY